MFRELGNKRGIAVYLQQSACWLFGTEGDQAIIRPARGDAGALQGIG